jgi:hypothetical protein
MYDAILKLFENKPATPHSQPAGEEMIVAVDHVIEAMDDVIALSDSIATEASAQRRRVASSRWLH